MTALIYITCLFCAAIVQTILKSILHSGILPVIPGSAVIYFIAFWAAKKWSNAYKEKKEIKQIQNELVQSHKGDTKE